MIARQGQLRIVGSERAPVVLPGARADRGYLAVYRPDEQNRCPGCGGSNWYVGRSTAQCAFCDTAIPIASNGKSS